MLIYAQSIWSEAMKSLRRNLVRTVLTVLGLMVGIAAFICVVGVGRAGSAKVEEQLQKLGDNMIWVEAGSRARSGVRIGSRASERLVMHGDRTYRGHHVEHARQRALEQALGHATDLERSLFGSVVAQAHQQRAVAERGHRVFADQW